MPVPRSEDEGYVAQRSFLVKHDSEDLLLSKFVLDRYDVSESFNYHYQHSVQQKAGNVMDKNDTSRQDGPAPPLGIPDTEVFSSVDTDTTQKISNVDRVSPKAKFRARAQAKRGSKSPAKMRGREKEDLRALRKMSSFTSEGSFVDDSDLGMIPEDMQDMQDMQGKKDGIMKEYLHKQQNHQANEGRSGGSHFPSKGPLSPALACVSGTYGTIKGRGMGKVNFLELRMEANLVSFYRREYLRAFPDSPQPKGMQPNIISDIAHAFPRDERPIMYAVDNSSFLNLVVTGSLDLIDRHHDGNKNKRYLVLMDGPERLPVAVCALKSNQESPVVRIFATKPCALGQKAAASSGDIGILGQSVDLYAWAEFAMEGEFPNPVRYSIYLSVGKDGKFEREPSFKGSHPIPGLPEITVVGRTGRERTYRGCCVLSIISKEGTGEDAQSLFNISISRGIDPAIFVCFAAIVDEVVESTMRKQCASKRRSRHKRLR